MNRAQLNLLDSHDVPRALHSLNGDLKALKLALLLLFLQPGAPCIYYGTEAGLAGGPNSGQVQRARSQPAVKHFPGMKTGLPIWALTSSNSLNSGATMR